MAWPDRATRVLRRILQRRQAERELDEEVRSYFEISVAREMERGFSREEAQRLIRIRCEGPEQVKERVRQSWAGAQLRTVWQDAVYAWRTLKKRPGYAATAIGTLALGIGANALMFSLVSGVLLRPLPFAHPDRLVQLTESDPIDGTHPVYYPDLEQWRKQSSSFTAMIAYGNVSKVMDNGDEPQRITAAWAERGLFQMLGAEPLLGRTFRPDDPPHVVVLSAGLWKGRFAADPSCIGRKIVLDREAYTVIGVMPDDFQFPYRSSRTQVWVPWQVPLEYAQGRSYRVDFVAARLKTAVPVDTATKELGVISKRLEAAYPETGRDRHAVITPFSEVITGHVRPALLTLLGAVGMVLLIACANVMNLLLARMAGRTHEIAVRSALGASRRRLLQQLLTESLTVSMAGGVAGLLLALGSLRILLNLASQRLPRAWEISFDWRVFCFLAAVTIGVGVLFGLAPALSLSRLGTQGNRPAGYGLAVGGARLRSGLVMAEITLAFLLLAGAGLLLKAFLNLQSTPTGLVADRVLTLHLSIALGDYSAPGSYGRYLRQLEERVTALPGVRAAGCIQFLPLQNWHWQGGFSLLTQAGLTQGGRSIRDEPRAELRYVSPGYFRAFGIPLRGGRLFTARDTSDSPRVILVNEALARRYFPNRNAIGERTDRGAIIGVVGDVRQSGLDHPASPEIYYSFAQNTAATSDAGVSLVVSTSGRPETVAREIREAIHQANPHQALFDVKPMNTVIAESISDRTLYLWLIGLFAAIALLLSVAGIYGVVSYAVAARTREFGIRLALGAGSRGLFSLVLREGSLLVGCGVLAGVAGALALTRTLESFVPGVTSADPILMALVSFLLIAVALAACLVPARSAARVDPNVALRHE